MNIPQSFEERLRSAFDGRLRIRWSVRDREYRIEQKVGRAVVPPIRIDEDRDDLICARDGFDYVLTVRPGDRMPCPTCQFAELKVPVREFADIRCPYCASRGKQGRTVAGYFPLDDSLLTYLKKLDPLRGRSKELAAQADRQNAALLASQEREMSNITYAQGAEHFNEMVGISQFGYSQSKQWPADLGPTPIAPAVATTD